MIDVSIVARYLPPQGCIQDKTETLTKEREGAEEVEQNDRVDKI